MTRIWVDDFVWGASGELGWINLYFNCHLAVMRSGSSGV